MASSSAKERRHLQAVLSPLVNSMRGQIFLLNLSLAVKVIGAPKFKSAFMGVLARDAKRMHEDDYLPHLKGVLQKASSGLLLQCKVSSFPEFAPDRWLVNVLPFVSFKTYYEDPTAALSGHIPFSSMPGNSVKRYKAGAATAPYWWVAGRTSFPSTSSVQSDAQGCRDVLGLVHFANDVDLVAMHVQVRVCDVYRPTVVEANPNARFRHRDPMNPKEDRWGKTIDLAKLSHAHAADIGGLPELVAAKLDLASSDDVEFFYLGRPIDDRSTSSSDRRFLDSLMTGIDPVKLKNEVTEELLK